jgi:hypothetical protein
MLQFLPVYGRLGLGALVLATCLASSGQAQQVTASMQAISTFGTNGWLTPASSSGYLTTNNEQRGMTYNAVTNEVLVAFRQTVSSVSNSIARFNGTTGAFVGVMDKTGITGGDFAINGVDVTTDGVIYAANTASGSNPFKVYRWENATATPTTAFNNTINTAPIAGITHLGQAFAVFGTGSATQFAAGGTTTTNTNNFAIGSGLSAGTFSVATPYINVTPRTASNSNDYRLGLTYVDANTIIGLQGGSTRLTDFDGTTATVAASSTGSLGGTINYRIIDYINVAGTPIVAGLNVSSSRVDIFNFTNPTSPVSLANLNLTTSPASNGNGTGAISWGDLVDNGNGTFTAELYAMSTNQGIQAFQVTMVPEPTTWALLGTVGVSTGVAMLRRRWKRRG